MSSTGDNLFRRRRAKERHPKVKRLTGILFPSFLLCSPAVLLAIYTARRFEVDYYQAVVTVNLGFAVMGFLGESLYMRLTAPEKGRRNSWALPLVVYAATVLVYSMSRGEGILVVLPALFALPGASLAGVVFQRWTDSRPLQAVDASEKRELGRD